MGTLITMIEPGSTVLVDGTRYRLPYIYRVKGNRIAVEAENLDHGGWSQGSVPDTERFEVVEAPAAVAA